MIKGEQAQRAQTHKNSIYYISFSQNMRCEWVYEL